MPELPSSRSLLLPGPQPPLSHFGATLLRHVVAGGVRFALHSLGAPMPEGAPIRIVRLRLYLDHDKLAAALGEAPAASELLAALLDPAGSGTLPQTAAAVSGAVAFHRTRLRFRPSGRAVRVSKPSPSADPEALWLAFRSAVSAFQPLLSDALLGELLGSLDRRQARSKDQPLVPCLGSQALALRLGRDPDLSSLGVPDPLVGPWSESPDIGTHVASRLDRLPAADGHRWRGEFREAYRRALNPIRTAYLRLATSARDRGLIDEVGDAFFIPFDLAEDLAGDQPPAWLPPAVMSNRAEYQRMAEAASPPERIARGAVQETVEDRADWVLGPLWPLD